MQKLDQGHESFWCLLSHSAIVSLTTADNERRPSPLPRAWRMNAVFVGQCPCSRALKGEMPDRDSLSRLGHCPLVRAPSQCSRDRRGGGINKRLPPLSRSPSQPSPLSKLATDSEQVSRQVPQDRHRFSFLQSPSPPIAPGKLRPLSLTHPRSTQHVPLLPPLALPPRAAHAASPALPRLPPLNGRPDSDVRPAPAPLHRADRRGRPRGLRHAGRRGGRGCGVERAGGVCVA